MMQVTAEKMATYRTTARRRWAREQRQLAEYHERAWGVARQAGAMLRERFGAGRVVVFGSLVRQSLFHSRSDVDLAVWGLEDRSYYRAVAQLLALDPAIEVDMVMAEEASAALLASVEKEGVEV